ncbi:Ski oncogene [Manis javanica]|nr:Ski oncogene [Manis javanica]
MTAIEGAVVHWLVLSVSVSLQAGAGAALCLVWGRGAVVGAFPEGGGVPIGSEADLRTPTSRETGTKRRSCDAGTSSGKLRGEDSVETDSLCGFPHFARGREQ